MFLFYKTKSLNFSCSQICSEQKCQQSFRFAKKGIPFLVFEFLCESIQQKRSTKLSIRDFFLSRILFLNICSESLFVSSVFYICFTIPFFGHLREIFYLFFQIIFTFFKNQISLECQPIRQSQKGPTNDPLAFLSCLVFSILVKIIVL